MNGSTPSTPSTHAAMFGAGCFWGVEHAFRAVPGVVETAVGYSGGKTRNPTYKQVCYENTGHVEVVRVEFDPARVTYEKLVEYFFRLHDPTQVNRQGPDYGTQYRTVIFTYNDEQRRVAESVRDRAAKSGRWKRPIATSIENAREFYKAEEYHQRYFEKNGGESCHIAPPLDEPL